MAYTCPNCDRKVYMPMACCDECGSALFNSPQDCNLKELEDRESMRMPSTEQTYHIYQKGYKEAVKEMLEIATEVQVHCKRQNDRTGVTAIQAVIHRIQGGE